LVSVRQLTFILKWIHSEPIDEIRIARFQPDDVGIILHLPKESLDATLLTCSLSVWVLIGLFTYLNRYTRRRYFTLWTAAWIFYAVWLALHFTSPLGDQSFGRAMAKLWCVGASAALLIWGNATFLEIRSRQSLLGGFLGFLGPWSYVAASESSHPTWSQLPVFLLLSLASMVTATGFMNVRRRSRLKGAGLLALGFCLWSVQLCAFPFLLASEALICSAFLCAAGLQLFIAVSMIIMSLEEVRAAHEKDQQRLLTQQSENKTLTARIATTEERYQSLFEQASEAIVITDAEKFRILELNPTAQKLLGLSGVELGQHTLPSFCKLNPDSTLALSAGADWFAAATRESRIQLVRWDGSQVPAELSGSHIDFDGRPACQFFLSELTERLRLEQQLRQAEKLSALGQMISGVAHELNNPLAVIRGYVELILARHPLNDTTRTDLTKVAHETHRAARLVGNFLSFARQQSSCRRRIQLNDIILKAAEARKREPQLAGTELGG
jgi:PAS domain S-box-containing protein